MPRAAVVRVAKTWDSPRVETIPVLLVQAACGVSSGPYLTLSGTVPDVYGPWDGGGSRHKDLGQPRAGTVPDLLINKVPADWRGLCQLLEPGPGGPGVCSCLNGAQLKLGGGGGDSLKMVVKLQLVLSLMWLPIMSVSADDRMTW